MEKIVKDKFKIAIYDVEDKIGTVWERALLFSMISFMELNWISKNKYEEFGNTILHSKCF